MSEQEQTAQEAARDPGGLKTAEEVREWLDSGAIDDAMRECIHGHQWRSCYPCSRDTIAVLRPAIESLLTTREAALRAEYLAKTLERDEKLAEDWGRIQKRIEAERDALRQEVERLKEHHDAMCSGIGDQCTRESVETLPIDWVVKYNELLYAVEQKHTGESRHETALRCIREREVLLRAILPYADDVLPRTADRVIEVWKQKVQAHEDSKASNLHNFQRAERAEAALAALQEVQADELGTNLRIAQRIGIWKAIETGMAYEDAEVALFDRLTNALREISRGRIASDRRPVITAVRLARIAREALAAVAEESHNQAMESQDDE